MLTLLKVWRRQRTQKAEVRHGAEGHTGLTQQQERAQHVRLEEPLSEGVVPRQGGHGHVFRVVDDGLAVVRARDADEKKIAVIARDTLSDKIMDRIVDLEDLATDKYGRLLARVLFEHADMSTFLIEKRLAVPYAGRTKTVVCWKTHYQSASGGTQR